MESYCVLNCARIIQKGKKYRLNLSAGIKIDLEALSELRKNF